MQHTERRLRHLEVPEQGWSQLACWPMDEIDIDQIGDELVVAAVAATPAWVRRSVGNVVTAQQLEIPDNASALVDDAAERAVRYIERHLGALVHTDIDQQATTPLSIFRDAARFPVEVLHPLGATPVHRGDVSRWAFPNDPFAITPENLADVGPEVQTAGITWGAAKAGLHLERRRNEGLR